MTNNSMEHHVTDLNLSKQLEEEGVPQKSQFYWIDMPDGSWFVADKPFDRDKGHFYSAFLASEIGEMLPTNKIQTLKWFETWYCEAFDDVAERSKPIYREVDKTEANARGSMLLYLIKHNLINFKKEK